MFIDTHCHIADEAFPTWEEQDRYVSDALAAGVGIMLQADICSAERDRMYALVERHPGVLFPMIGLYPGNVDSDWEQEVAQLEKYLGRGPVAVGEIGLDYHYGKDTAALQKDAFRAQLELASKWGLPVNIHLREATDDFFDILESVKHLGLRGNLHAYSGSYETFLRLQKYGDWSVGIGGVVTFRKAALAEVAAKIPLERILLETDAPYLAPTPLRGTRNESANIPIIAEFLANLKGISCDEVERTTTANALNLFICEA